jgi:hypothetical protein
MLPARDDWLGARNASKNLFLLSLPGPAGPCSRMILSFL